VIYLYRPFPDMSTHSHGFILARPVPLIVFDGLRDEIWGLINLSSSRI